MMLEGRDLLFSAFTSVMPDSSYIGRIVAPAGPLIRLLSVMTVWEE